jgi:hypothetical protein
MVEATIAAILALQKRADHHGDNHKCAFVAGAEKLQEALVLAQRLPGLSEDNLVALYLQLERCQFLTAQGVRMNELSGDKAAIQEFHAVASSLLLRVNAALFRRMNAGTLLPGRCAPLEEAWFVVHSSVSLEVVRYGQLVGLSVVYAAAREALFKLMDLETFSPTHQHELLLLIMRTLIILSKPRPLENSVLPDEVVFMSMMLDFQEKGNFYLLGASFPACSCQLQQIRDAWARVQASGVVHRRDLHLTSTILASSLDKTKRGWDAANARELRRGLRSCGLASCGAKEAHVDHFKRCSACKTVVYCCKEHQLEHWPAHKAACKAARKAAAEGQ